MKPTIDDKLHTKIRQLRDELLTGLVERDDAVRLSLLAALSGEHLLLIGPPGTAKSLVARRLSLAFSDADYFERLLTRFTVPEELFGPYSIKGLENDRFERLTASYLPTASVAFLDEIFKANSAILNSMLTLLNERQFDNGTERQSTPIVAVVGASNELPESGELDALYDRFLCRLHVGPTSADGFRRLIEGSADVGTVEISDELRLTVEDRASLASAAREVTLPEGVVSLICDLRAWCAENEIEVSDRRWLKVEKLLRTSAASNGRSEATLWDCWLLQHCLWTSPYQRDAIFEWYATRVGASEVNQPEQVSRLIRVLENEVAREFRRKEQDTDQHGELLFERSDGAVVPENQSRLRAEKHGEPLFLPPQDFVSNRHRHIERSTKNALTESELDSGYVRVHGRLEHFSNWSQREQYLADEKNWAMTESKLTPHLVQARQKPSYIESLRTRADRVGHSIESYRARVERHRASLDDEIVSHLWVDDGFTKRAAAQLDVTLEMVDHLQSRVEHLRLEITRLPVHQGADPEDRADNFGDAESEDAGGDSPEEDA